MILDARSKYPSARSYVLKVRGDAIPGALVGRLENLVTGQHHEFASGGELLQALEAELASAGAAPPNPQR